MTDKEVLLKVFKNYIENNSKKMIVTIIFLGVLLAGVAILEPFFMKEVVSVIENYIGTGEFNLDFVIKIFIFWFIFIVFVNGFKLIFGKLVASSNLNNYRLNHLNEPSRLLNMSYGEYLTKKQGKLFKVYDRGIESQLSVIFFFLEEFIYNIFTVIIAIIILFVIDYRMAIVTLIFLPFIVFMGMFFGKKTRVIQDNLNKKRDEAFGYFGDGISNMGLLKTLSIKNRLLKFMKIDVNNAHEKQLDVMSRWIIADIYTQFIILISRFFVLGFGMFFLIKGELDFATLFLFFAYIPYIYYPIGFIFRRLQNIQKDLSGIRKYYEEFDNIELDKDSKNSKVIKKSEGKIEFKDVNFGYTKDKKIFNKLNFEIKSGEKIAFVGNTGAGKSTIVNLLFRFWNVNKGEILLDGENINNISKDSLRKHVGLVAQDNSLFNTTIKQNMLFAKEKATKKEIEIALKKAQADFVFDLEKGINTVIGERGLKLSGGEKQRLSIARLFLKNPEILVLDEATSALDNKTEKKVQKALDELMKGRTSIVIAHRLSTIQNADKIFMLENGKIVESGKYEKLMENKGKFYNLANPEHLIIN